MAISPMFMDSDPTVIPNPKPNTHYFWSPAHPDILSDYLVNGYRLVVGKEEATALFGDDAGSVMLTPEGRIRRGDWVLCYMPMDRWIECEGYLLEKARRQKEGAAEALYNKIDNIGNKHIRPFMVDAADYDERKQVESRDVGERPRIGYTGPTPPTPPSSK